jgi:hypothetical protein
VADLTVHTYGGATMTIIALRPTLSRLVEPLDVPERYTSSYRYNWTCRNHTDRHCRP